MSLLEVDIGGGELDSVQLTAKGLEVLRSLDSRCFGFLGIHCEEQLTSNRDGTTQQQQQQQPPNETNFVTRKFIQAGIKKLAKELSLGPQSPSYHPELLCQLGHLHLLLEEYKPALSVYRQYQSMYPTDSSSNVNLLYGLGLIYFHCNAYKWAIQVLQSVLELSPSFARSSEVHLRLGVIFKKREDYDRSLQHFRRALCITGPSAFNKLEIQFHIGHLCFLQGNNLAAKEVFETILSSKSVPSSIKAMTLKQLGWLYHSVPEVTNSTPDPHTKATELLTLAVGADPTSSQAWYFLGRCHAHQGCIQEAFLAYQYAISRGDDNQSNTWCSIGLLYHKMMQPKDSLQSYLCAVYLDPNNLAAWTNMGCLYEAIAQPVDALLSYKNAAAVIRGSKKHSGKCSEHVMSRMSTLEQYVGVVGSSGCHQPQHLPSFHDAWTTLIPANIRDKRNPPTSPILHLSMPFTNLSPPHSTHPRLPTFGPMPLTPNTPHGPLPPPPPPQQLPPHYPPAVAARPPLGPPTTKRARPQKSKDPIIIRNINEGWSARQAGGVMSPPFTPLLVDPAGGAGAGGVATSSSSSSCSGPPPVDSVGGGGRGGFSGMALSSTGLGSASMPSFDTIGHNCGFDFASSYFAPDFPSSLPPHSSSSDAAIGSSFLNMAYPSSSSLPPSSSHQFPPPTQTSAAGTCVQQATSSPHLGDSLLHHDADCHHAPNSQISPAQDPLQDLSNLPCRPLNPLITSVSGEHAGHQGMGSPACSSPLSLPSLPPLPSVSLASSFHPAPELPLPPSSSSSSSSSTSCKAPSPLLRSKSSPMPWESPTPSNSPMVWVSPSQQTPNTTTTTTTSAGSPDPVATLATAVAGSPSQLNTLSHHNHHEGLASPKHSATTTAAATAAATTAATAVALPIPLHMLQNEGPGGCGGIVGGGGGCRSGSGSRSGSIVGFSPHSLPSSLISEAPFSPLAGSASAGGLSSTFNKSSALSPESLPNPVPTLYGNSHLHHGRSHSHHRSPSLERLADNNSNNIHNKVNNKSNDSNKGNVCITSQAVTTGETQVTTLPPTYHHYHHHQCGGNEHSSLAAAAVATAATIATAMGSPGLLVAGEGGSLRTFKNEDELQKSKKRSKDAKSSHSAAAKAKKKLLSRLPFPVVGEGQLLSCQEPGELLTIFQDHEVPFLREEVSDGGGSGVVHSGGSTAAEDVMVEQGAAEEEEAATALHGEEISDSGVSSLGGGGRAGGAGPRGKPSARSSGSSSSENSSPCETASPLAFAVSLPRNHTHHTISNDSMSKPHPPGRFSYPEASAELPELLSPIYEPYPSLASEAEYMILSPKLQPPKPPDTKPGINLNPQVEIYQVKDAVDAMSVDLHAFCSHPDRPICMIRGFCNTLNVDISVFSSESLSNTCPDHEIEVREQIQQAADENCDPTGRRQVWKCESSRSSTTILEYTQYQRRVYLRQEDCSQSSDSNDSMSSDESSSHAGAAAAGSSGGGKSRPILRKPHKTMIRFGTNVDLSDTNKWSRQLSQLEKLPNFLRVACPRSDFLPHIGHTILGMNSVQLYMKVPGARTPGHQENNNFCSININIGPGDCEWFAVHNQYWGVFHKLCEKNKLCFLTGSWWPVLSELEELGVPVYRFTQYVGDVVWLNPGTVHWVQANNVCNNIAWNVGPLTAHQFRMAWERYQWNKVQKVRSIVPMVHMTWNLVQNVKIIDQTLFNQLRSLLKGSVLQTRLLLTHLKNSDIPIHWHGREKGEPAPCCNNCLDEVFNILFVLNHRGEYLVYCHKCASSLKKSFTVLQQYKLEELDSIVESFKLHPSSAGLSTHA